MVREWPEHAGYIWSTDGLQHVSYSMRAEAQVAEAVMPPSLFVCQHNIHDRPSGIFYGGNPLTYSFPLVLLEISFVLVAIHLVRFILKPLRQPKIVAEILGGILVGPSLLGRNKKFKDFLFPENSDFMVKNIGLIGFLCFLFVSGVKMDMTLLTKSSKKYLCISTASVMIPMVTVLGIGFGLRNKMDPNLANVTSLGAVSSAVAITTFPVLYPFLKELNLLSSEVGRMALSTSIIIDVFGMVFLFAFEFSKQSETHSNNAGWYALSFVVVVFLVFVFHKAMALLVKRAHSGKPINQGFIVLIILFGTLSCGFITDMFGLAIANGPMWFGLAVPDGPPLGSILVERCETIASDILMPFSFAFIGMYVDLSLVGTIWPVLKPLVFMVVVGYVTKIFITLLAALYFRVPLRDSIALSLILSVRGQVEVFLFIHWMDKGILHPTYFTMMILLTVLITATVSPLVSLLYDPSKPYMVSTRRTIQHTPPGVDLRILVTVEDQRSVAGLVTLLDASNPSVATPFSVIILCLIELVGRAAPVFIDHEKQLEIPAQYASCLTIHNAFSLYQESRSEFLKLHSYTTITPKRTAYQDICELAVVNKSTLIILPFESNDMDSSDRNQQLVSSFVLSNAPCSVGIFVDKGRMGNPLVSNVFGRSGHHFAILFLGGADARETLAYADRMLGNPDVCMTVIRFLSLNGEGDNELEKKLDDGVITWFWVKNESNERVMYREVVVRNGAETVAAIQAINEDTFSLWVVGRKEGINPVLLQGLSDWTENHQVLGIIGDYVTATDFGGNASVLVIQQQSLREQDAVGEICGSKALASLLKSR